MKVLRRNDLPGSGGIFLRRIQEHAASEEEKSGRKITVLPEMRLSRSIGRLDSRNPSAFFLYLNMPSIRLLGLIQKNGAGYRDLFLEEYFLAHVRLAGSVYEERPLSYPEGLAACFLAVRQETKGCIDIPLPGIPRMLLNDKNRDWQADRLYCELQAMEAAIHGIYDGDDSAEPAMSSSVTSQSLPAGSACGAGNNIYNGSQEKMSLIRQRELLAAFADMPEIIYDRKGMPHLAVCRLLDLTEDLQRTSPDLFERCPVLRALCRIRQIPENKFPDVDSKADPFEKELAARWICLNSSAANASNLWENTAASVTAAIAEYETRAGIFIQRNRNYNYRAFRDNRIAIARTLVGADAVRTVLPFGITGGKVHPLGYW